MLDRFFHYVMCDGLLVGSEHPSVLGRLRAVVDQMIQDYGVRVLITLTPRFESFHIAALAQHHVPITGVPTSEEVARAVAIIRDHTVRHEPVWVHCQQGLDRTACIIGCHRVASGENPDAVLADLLAVAPPRRRHPAYQCLWEPYAQRVRQSMSSKTPLLRTIR
ncbi:MAG: protein-tyrosine phosphatase family protein [Phycisphaeraceae bacterium]